MLDDTTPRRYLIQSIFWKQINSLNRVFGTIFDESGLISWLYNNLSKPKQRRIDGFDVVRAT